MTREQQMSRLYAEFAAGRLTEEDVAKLEAKIQSGPAQVRFWPIRKRRKAGRRDMEHRRRLAFSGPMPPALAARFTVSQLAVLRIVADVQPCALSVIEIAERAGVSTRTVQMALRLAAGDGLVQIRERRLSAARNDTNIVTVISPEWRAWIARGGRKSQHPRDNKGLRNKGVKSKDWSPGRDSNPQRKGSPASPTYLTPKSPER